MTPGRKAGMVAIGYVVAFALASMAVAIRIASEGPEAVLESGMRSFGDMVLFVAVFGACALVPTAAALYFLRANRSFWIVLSALALAAAVSAVGAAALYGLGRHDTATFGLWLHLSILRLLVAPLLVCTFLLAAIFAPLRGPRLALGAATILEAGAFAVAGLVLAGIIGGM